MWLTKKILVPTDFGDPSRAAARAGLEFAQHFQVPLVLLHVYGVPGTAYDRIDLALAESFARSLESSARTALNKEGALLQGKGVAVTAILDSGVAWERILEAAKNVDAGLIVMGTHGRRGLPHALLGSVAEKVVRLSPVPVLTVHEPPQEDAAIHKAGAGAGR